MSKDKNSSNLRFPYEQLIQYSESLLINLYRDTIVFDNYGIKEPQKQEFEKKVNALKKLPDNKELMKGRSLVTRRKQKIISDLKDQLRDVQLRVQLAFGKYSETFTALKAKNIANLNELELIETGERYIKFSEANAEALMKFGFKKENYDLLKNSLINYEKSVYDFSIIEDRRRRYSEKRRVLAEELYENLVNYCHIGKVYWSEYGNQQKYKEYLLYPEQKKAKKTNFKREIQNQ